MGWGQGRGCGGVWWGGGGEKAVGSVCGEGHLGEESVCGGEGVRGGGGVGEVRGWGCVAWGKIRSG